MKYFKNSQILLFVKIILYTRKNKKIYKFTGIPGLPGMKGHRGFAGSDGAKGKFSTNSFDKSMFFNCIFFFFKGDRGEQGERGLTGIGLPGAQGPPVTWSIY